VTDMARSRRFYEELFGFAFLREIHPPDDLSGKLLRVDPPLGMSAVYLQRDGLVLELLHFDRPANPQYRERVMNEPGLTHLSLSDGYWVPIGPRLVAAGHPAIYVDTRGHGASGLPRAPGFAARGLHDDDVSPERIADDFVEVLDHAGVAKAAFTGHSMGVQAI